MSAVSTLMRRTFLSPLPVRGVNDSKRREGTMERKTGTAAPRARRIVTVSWTGWSDSCEATLCRTAGGRFVRFRVDGTTEAGHETTAAPGAADVLLRALWHTRHPPAVSLAGFTRAGLLSKERLNEIHVGLRETHAPQEPTRTGPAGTGDLFYDSGALRYRGSLRGGLPHGLGVGYWENGAVWCEGSFRNGEHSTPLEEEE